MCGRYASSRRPEDLVEEFRVEETNVGEALAPDFNVAPTKPVYAVLQRPERTNEQGVVQPSLRQLRVLSWGLVPSWVKDPSLGSRMINARVETVAQKPAFRKAFAARRCLLPADGYYEWYPTEQLTAKGKPRKQPFFIRPRDGGLLAMAGLYEIWRDPSRTDDDPERFRWSCTIITTRAEDSLGHIHDRMPLTVPRDAWAQWLDPGRSAGPDLLDLLTTTSSGTLDAYPVSDRVNSVRNSGAELVEPMPFAEEAAP